MTFTRTRVTIVATLILLVLAAGPGTAVAGAPVARPGLFNATSWGYVVVRQPNANMYEPAAMDRGNSTGGSDLVTHTGHGTYEVGFAGIGTSGGSALVSPLGSSSRRCAVDIWFQDSANELVDIDCYTASGAPADSTFIVTYVNSVANSGRMAYAEGQCVNGTDSDANCCPASPSCTPAEDQYDSAATPHDTGITMEELFDGTHPFYRLTAAHLGQTNLEFGGTIAVAALGGSPTTCRGGVWGWGGGDTEALFVTCYTPSGTAVAAPFDIVFMQKLGLKGDGGAHVAYVYADQPKKTAYTPAAASRYSSAGKAPKISRSGPGTYVVTLAGMPDGGAAIVTPVGNGKTACTVASIRRSGTPQKVGVRCFAPSGAAADSQFTLSYER